MGLNDFTAESVLSANGAVIRTLWPGISASREPEWLVGFGAPKKIFLLEAKPEVVVIIIYCYNYWAAINSALMSTGECRKRV